MEEKKPTSNEVELEEDFDLFNYTDDIEMGVMELKLNDDNEAPADLHTILEKIYKNKIGLLTKDNYNNVRRPLVVAFHTFKKNALKLRNWMDLLYELSQRYNFRRINFFVADVQDSHLFYGNHNFTSSYYRTKMAPYIYAEDCYRRQFKCSVLDNFSFVKYPEKCKLIFSGESAVILKDFLKRLLNNQLFFSEPLPVETELHETKVKTAVANNFQALVENSETDVLVIFYADWCRFSKELLPEIDELSLILSDDSENLSIVKINVERNYVPAKYYITRYPTIMYISRNDKQNPIIHYGNRSNEYLIRFIAQNSTFELKNYDCNGNKRNT